MNSNVPPLTQFHYVRATSQGHFERSRHDGWLQMCRSQSTLQHLNCSTKALKLFRYHLLSPCMEGPLKERWQELCAQAAVEQDPMKLLELAREINDILEEKERRLLGKPSTREKS